MRFRDDVAKGRFEAVDDGQVVGWVEYERRPGALDLNHTLVPPEFGGRGIGKAVVAYAVGEARARGLAVIPTCPFVLAYVDANPE